MPPFSKKSMSPSMSTNSSKSVAASQKAIDALPLDSGTWRIQGLIGFYIRCRKSKGYFVQRRVEKELVREYLGGDMTLKEARALAVKKLAVLKPRPAPEGVVTLEAAVNAYCENRRMMGKMSDKTLALATYNTERYLEPWKSRTLEQIGRDRAGIAEFHAKITRNHGKATCNQVTRLLAAVYRWHQDRIQTDLPEWPRRVAEVHSIPARNWAYSDEELKAWWSAAAQDGKRMGVSSLGALKRMWWLTALFTGARKGSIEALRWQDVDLDKRTIFFSLAKGGRVYTVPIADVLAKFLGEYRVSEEVPPSDWVFPSNVIEGAHLTDVKNPNEGVGPAHRLRHAFRTKLAQLGATTDHSRLLMGHSVGRDVSGNYITSSLVIESLRPVANAVAQTYAEIIGLG